MKAYFAALFFAVALPNATAAEEASSLSTPERRRIENLMDRSVEAGRLQAQMARDDGRLSADDRRDAQSQFALLLVTVDRCHDAVAFVRERTEIMASGIERLMRIAQMQSDKACVVNFAPFMAERWQDHYLTKAGQIGKRYLAAAYLDAAGHSDARAMRNAAEAELLSLPGSENVWQARWDAVSAYSDTSSFMRYLEYLADRMVAEGTPMSVTRDGILTLFAGKNRCDLVERVLRNGPQSCERSLRHAEGIYINPKPPANSAAMLKAFGAETPSISEQSYEMALASPTPWLRLTKLLQLASACRKALNPPEL